MSYQRNQRIAFVLLIVAFVFQGCSLLGLDADFVRPQVSLTDARVEEANLFETSMVFTLRIDNDNPEELSFQGGSHKLYLNDLYVGKGFSQEPFSVPAFSSEKTQVLVFVSNLNLLAKLIPIFESGDIGYRVDSSLVLERSGRTRRIEVTRQDKFSLAQRLDTSRLKPLVKGL